MKKLSAAQQFILQLLEDKGSRHRDWIGDICKQRGYRAVNRSINSLVEHGYLTVDEDDYVTAGRAELAAEPASVGESVTAEKWGMTGAEFFQCMTGDTLPNPDEIIRELAAKLARAEAEIVRLRALLNSLTPGYMRSV